MRKLSAILLVLALFSMKAQAELVKSDFRVICTQLLHEQPSFPSYSTYFTQGFQTSVSLEELKAIFSELYSEVGKCTSSETKALGQGEYQLTLVGLNQSRVLLSVHVDEATGQVSGLMVEGIEYPDIQIQKWDDLKSALNQLNPAGKSSATLMTQDGSLSLFENTSEAFAIGSTFKLYILGALELSIEKGSHHWDERLPIKDEWKSFPSGIMHTWPTGKEVKLVEYGALMISISDNTATDHLLHLLGREAVEEMLAPMGNTHEAGYLPFLTTQELFKLKWALKPEETNAYLYADHAGRLRMLDRLSQVPRDAVGKNGAPLGRPTLIDHLEWFATTSENCEAMFWLASRPSQVLRRVLSINVPLIKDVAKEDGHWAYAGYKGGSEPGVLSMTFLLESKRGKRGCFAMSVNNSSKPISQFRFMDIAKKTLKFAEQKF